MIAVEADLINEAEPQAITEQRARLEEAKRATACLVYDPDIYEDQRGIGEPLMRLIDSGRLRNGQPPKFGRPARTPEPDKESDSLSPSVTTDEGTGDKLPPTEPVSEKPYQRPADLPGVRSLADVPRLNRDYLDYPRLPRGIVTQCIGDAGAGKGAVLFDIAARVTRGDVSIDGSAHYQTGNVLILSAEEEAEYAISKRLDAAGAISERVFVVDEQITFPSGWKRLLELVEHYGAVFVIVDGLFDYLDDGINPISTAHMRSVYHAYGKVARKTQCAIVPVQHIGQGKRTSINQLANNSNAPGQVTRSALYVARLPDQPDVRVLTQFKNSDGPLADSMTFTIEPAQGDDQAFRVKWGDPTPLTATDLMPGEYKPEKAEQDARPEDYVLRAYMDANNWDVNPSDALKHLRDAGFIQYKSPSGQAVQRLRLRLSILSVRIGFPAKTRWRSKSPTPIVSD